MTVERTHFVVFGATGFTAQAVIKELTTRCGSWLPSDFSWALGGRNVSKLETQAAAISNFPKPHVVVADVGDQHSLLKMAQSTKRMHPAWHSAAMITLTHSLS
jgi:short subunit dehydrogenase-like uncharacterized protein